jgi:hypothetical protein
VSNNWSVPTTPDVVNRRAGGRRHYNRWRQTLALIRRTKVSRLLVRYPFLPRGTVTAIARQLGVHPSTICRDIKALLLLGKPCPTCGTFPKIGPDPDLIDDLIDDLLDDDEEPEPSADEPPVAAATVEPAPVPNRLG